LYLTTPSTQELQDLEVPILLDMLSKQTSLYSKLLHEEGRSNNTIACKEILMNVQAVIAVKINSEKAINKESE
jgi:hypothetical protein